MLASDWVYAFHWVIYILSFVAFALLFTRYRKWGAVWIAGLFLTQGIFHGCLVVDLQNYYLAKEGLPTITNDMLTADFSSLIWVQALLCYAVAIAAGIVAVI